MRVLARPAAALLAALSAPSAPARDFSVGGAYAGIMPDGPMPNYYRTPLRADPGASPLRVQVVICAEGAERVALVSVDCTFLGRAEVLRIRDGLRRRIGIDPDRVCVAATHSHAAPATTASFLNGELPDPKYLDLIVERAAAAAEAAMARLRPARIAAATVAAPPIMSCRRRLSPDGQAYMMGSEPDAAFVAENPIDPEMRYIVFEDPAGAPLAAVFAFGCHNNLVGRVFSADMFGRAGDALRERLGDIATVTLAAPCGDVAVGLPGGKKPVRDDTEAGRAIAEAILKSYHAGVRREEGSLRVASVLRRMPDRPYDPAEFVYDNARGSSPAAVAFHRARYEPEEAAVRARGQTYCDVEIQAIGFGSVALVTNPAELFSVYGLRIARDSPFRVTLVAELANGYCGYVPTPQAFKHRGYETYRTVYTSRLAKDAGERIAGESIALLQVLHAARTAGR